MQNTFNFRRQEFSESNSLLSGTAFLNWAITILVALGSFNVQLAGQILITEILCTVFCVYLIFTRVSYLLALPAVGLVTKSMISGLVIYAVSDVLNSSDFIDVAKGALRWAFMLTSFITFVYVLTRSKFSPVYLMLGITISGFIFAWRYSSEAGYGWKFSLGEPITALILIVCIFLPKHLSTLMAISIGVINFYLDYRSLAGACLVCAAFSALCGSGIKINKFLLVGVISISFISIGAYLYSKAILDNDQRSARSLDSNEVRLTGFNFGIQAIKLSPIYGHGTWASKPELMYLYTQLLQDAKRERGARITGEEEGYAAVVGAIHSMVLQGGAEAGIVCSFIFLFFAFIIVSGFIAIYKNFAWMRALEILSVYICVLSLWAVFSSPFAGYNRILLAMGLALSVRLLLIARDFVPRIPLRKS
ncbi:MAG: hypothetical protein NTU80_12490 [Verrucomicrobia bacterium]|nr:hypothetical protein [Verrucomicrobiota bacterium]